MIKSVLNSNDWPTHESNEIYIDFDSINTMSYNIDVINNCIINLLMTRKGSVPGKPTYGSDLHKIPFEQMDYVTEDALKISIKSTLSIWESRIEISKIVVTSSDEYNKMIADIYYKYNDNSTIIDSEVSIPLGDI